MLVCMVYTFESYACAGHLANAGAQQHLCMQATCPVLERGRNAHATEVTIPMQWLPCRRAEPI